MAMKDEAYTQRGIAIVNPYGGIWTSTIFETPEAAMAHLKAYWSRVESYNPNEWKLAMATLTVTLDRPPGEPVLISLPT